MHIPCAPLGKKRRGTEKPQIVVPNIAALPSTRLCYSQSLSKCRKRQPSCGGAGYNRGETRKTSSRTTRSIPGTCGSKAVRGVGGHRQVGDDKRPRSQWFQHQGLCRMPICMPVANRAVCVFLIHCCRYQDRAGAKNIV